MFFERVLLKKEKRSIAARNSVIFCCRRGWNAAACFVRICQSTRSRPPCRQEGKQSQAVAPNANLIHLLSLWPFSKSRPITSSSGSKMFRFEHWTLFKCEKAHKQNIKMFFCSCCQQKCVDIYIYNFKVQISSSVLPEKKYPLWIYLFYRRIKFCECFVFCCS